jgi:short-subunit dehydrogenase
MARKTLSGQAVLVTGAARGIGRALTEQLIAKQANVIMADIDPSVERAAESLGVRSVILDVTDPASWSRAIEAIGTVDVLVNNAGIMPIGSFLDHTPEDDAKQFAVNVHGVIHGMRAVIPGMEARGRGHIINVSSLAGRVGTPNIAVYSATKFGVVGITEAVRAELGLDTPIDFSYVCPALVDTELISGTGRPKWPAPLKPEDVGEAIIDAFERRRVEVYVPKIGRLTVIFPAILPRLLVEKMGRFFHMHTMFEKVDHEARSTYRRRILGR